MHLFYYKVAIVITIMHVVMFMIIKINLVVWFTNSNCEAKKTNNLSNKLSDP